MCERERGREKESEGERERQNACEEMHVRKSYTHIRMCVCLGVYACERFGMCQPVCARVCATVGLKGVLEV